MTILHIINDLKTGGAQKLLADIVPIMKKHGNIVDILTFEDDESDLKKALIQEGVNVFSFRSKYSRNPLNILKIQNLLNNYEIIHSHTTAPQLYLALASSKKHKIITTEHSTSNRRRNLKWYRPVDKFMYNKYNKIICISEAAKDNLLKWTESKIKSKFVVVKNGVNLEKFKVEPSLLKEPAISGKKLITMVSRFVPAKDQATVIRAIPLIEDSNVVFVFVGEGTTKYDIENLAEKLHVKDKCCFLGNREDVPNIIANSYIGIQSSFWEGFGLTAVEFMAAGKPIIASEVEGLKQVVENAGLLFKQGDEKQLAQEINNLLEDKSFYSEISAKCRKRAQFFDINKTVEEYLSIYKDIST